MIKINNHRLREFTRHILIAQKNRIEGEEEEEGPKLFIQRSFPKYMQRQPVQVMPVVKQPPAVMEKPEGIFEVGKLTKFILDKMIDSIECSGPDNPIKIKKESYIFQTDLSLKEDEIMDVIKIFSKESKVPISPIFKADAKGFSIFALIASTGSRFLITRKK